MGAERPDDGVALAEYMDLPAYVELAEECRKTGDMTPLREMNGWLAEVDAEVAKLKASYAKPPTP